LVADDKISRDLAQFRERTETLQMREHLARLGAMLRRVEQGERKSGAFSKFSN
jgi:hypothetical protein